MTTKQATYVDGFVLVISKKNLAAYTKMARKGKTIWEKYGALDYKECIADDMRPEGCLLPFPKLMKTKPSDVVLFSFITYKSRKHRDMVNAQVMRDVSMNDPKYKDIPMPFDMKRMAFGGFKVIVG